MRSNSNTYLDKILHYVKNANNNNDYNYDNDYSKYSECENTEKIKKYECKLRLLNNEKYSGKFKILKNYRDYYYDDLKYNLRTYYYGEHIENNEKGTIIKNIINWVIERLMGVKYKLIYLDEKILLYKNTVSFYGTDGAIPNYSEIYKYGMNCIGLINLIYKKIYKKIPYLYYNRESYENGIGSLDHFINYIEMRNCYLKIKEGDIKHIQNSPGTIFFRKSSASDSGHIALCIGNGYIIHSWTELLETVNVNIDDKKKDDLQNPGISIDKFDDVNKWYQNPENPESYFQYYTKPNEWLFFKSDNIFARR